MYTWDEYTDEMLDSDVVGKYDEDEVRLDDDTGYELELLVEINDEAEDDENEVTGTEEGPVDNNCEDEDGCSLDEILLYGAEE